MQVSCAPQTSRRFFISRVIFSAAYPLSSCAGAWSFKHKYVDEKVFHFSVINWQFHTQINVPGHFFKCLPPRYDETSQEGLFNSMHYPERKAAHTDDRRIYRIWPYR